METIEHKDTTAATAPRIQADPIVELLAGWGLQPGRGVNGWTVDGIERSEQGNDVCIDLSRGSDSIRVRLRAAGSKPRFARVGDIDLVHDAVAAQLNTEVAALLKVMVTWLKRHDDGSALATLLASLPEVVDRTAALPPTAAWTGDPERAEHA